ncbi:MAG: helix-hairpin-helix domain-containing protein [Bacteroidota bacterium]
MTNILLHASDGGILGHCSSWWWWSILAFALGAILHRLLWGTGGEKVDVAAIEADRDRYHKQATKWETDYQSVKYQLEEAQKAEADLRASLQRCEADKTALRFEIDNAASAAAGFAAGTLANDDVTNVDADVTSRGIAGVPESYDETSIYAGLFDNDNFQIIEGVGPKVNQVLIDAGYKTWEDLSVANVDDLRGHLDAAGKRFALCDPTSWPHQAKLAAASDWDELIRYQKFTDGGRETTGDFETDSKFEKLAAKKLGFSSSNPNDLKVVEGIGPKIEGLLKEGGINTWAELAATEVSRIQEILDAAGPRYKLATPRTWPQQAGLAAEGKWAELKALQDDLQGGK